MQRWVDEPQADKPIKNGPTDGCADGRKGGRPDGTAEGRPLGRTACSAWGLSRPRPDCSGLGSTRGCGAAPPHSPLAPRAEGTDLR